MRTFFLLGYIFCCSAVFGQSVKNNAIDIEYIQPPIVKIDQNWTYIVKVTQTNANEIEEKKKAFEEKQQYYDDQYEKELEVYNNSKAAGKLIQGKPTRKVATPNFIGKIIDGPSLAKSAIDLTGFKRVESDSRFIIEIKFDGFSIVSNEKASDDKKKKRYYKSTFRSSYTVEVKNAQDNSLIWSESFLKDSRERRLLERSVDESAYDMEKEWKENKISLLKGLEDEVIKEDLDKLNEFINNQIGYPAKKQKVKFYSAKGKKFDYAQLNESINLVQKAFLINVDKPSEAIEYFDKALDIWEKELETKDLNDKKARINKKIATGLYVNVAYIQVLKKDIQKAKEYYLEAEILKPLRFASEIAELNDFIDEFEKRTN